MYSPKHYKEDRLDLVHEILRNFSFATLVSIKDNEPVISHLPVIFDSNRNVLISHCARANPHWRLFNQNSPVKVLFIGPHAYISPAWYKPDPSNVPTWNYVAVHISGVAQVIDDEEQAWILMNQFVQHYEDYYKTGWSLPAEPNEALKRDLQKGIVVFEISIDQVDSKFKLSQKQDVEDRASVMRNLPNYSAEQGQMLAEFMARFSYKE